jgi:hypothetical protein
MPPFQGLYWNKGLDEDKTSKSVKTVSENKNTHTHTHTHTHTYIFWATTGKNDLKRGCHFIL